MEKLQGSIPSSLYTDFEQQANGLEGFGSCEKLLYEDIFRFSEETNPWFESLPIKELLTLQNQKPQSKEKLMAVVDSRIPPLELESCITQTSEENSLIKREVKDGYYSSPPSCQEILSQGYNTEQHNEEECIQYTKKRKRMQTSKNKERIENQRMTHIAVERNRRKQMNEYINIIKSLMPPSFVQKSDQASIVGGAIDYVKELEQLLQSLQATKKQRRSEKEGYSPNVSSLPINDFFFSSKYSNAQSDFTYKTRSEFAEIEVTVIQTHANLKIRSTKRPRQLIKVVSAFEELHFSILHVNITTLEQQSVLYSFNLKIEEECKLGTAEEISRAVHQVLRFICRNFDD